MKRKKRSLTSTGFSLIEVLFAITILIMVGLAMTALNVAALKIIINNEITTTASILNDQSLAFVALEQKLRSPSDFVSYYTQAGCNSSTGCYVKCQNSDLTLPCSLQATPAPITLGRSKLRYTQKLAISAIVGTPTPNSYSIMATTSWGSGVREKSSVRQFIK